MNGVFALEEELYNGRALYRKVGDQHWWLRFAPDRTWAISDTVAKDANNNAGVAYSSSLGLSLPTDSSVWKVSVNGEWVKQAAMRVQPASEQVGARQGRACLCRTLRIIATKRSKEEALELNFVYRGYCVSIYGILPLLFLLSFLSSLSTLSATPRKRRRYL